MGEWMDAKIWYKDGVEREQLMLPIFCEVRHAHVRTWSALWASRSCPFSLKIRARWKWKAGSNSSNSSALSAWGHRRCGHGVQDMCQREHIPREKKV